MEKKLIVGSYPMPPVPADDTKNPMSESRGSENRKVERAFTNFYLGTSLATILAYRFYDGLFASLTTNIFIGSNVYPVGPRSIKYLIELLIFCLSAVDLVLVSAITTFYFCLGPDPTACQEHQALLLMYTLWPGATIVAPVVGMVAIVIGPNVTLTRIYASWLRLSLISTIVTIVLYNYYSSYFILTFYVAYFVAGLSSSRFVQLLVVDLYVAHLERARYTRGWDGLATSLSSTKDHQIDIKY